MEGGEARVQERMEHPEDGGRVEQLVVVQLAEQPHQADTPLTVAVVVAVDGDTRALDGRIDDAHHRLLVVAVQRGDHAGHEVDRVVLDRGTVEECLADPALLLCTP